MIRNRSIILLSMVGVAAFAGCATVNPQLDYAQVGQRVAEATGQENIYQPENDEFVAERLDELLRDGITADEAVQVCLLNNPTLHAAFMDIGMARVFKGGCQRHIRTLLNHVDDPLSHTPRRTRHDGFCHDPFLH